jgi:predicted secreted hydrolase
MNGYLDEKTGNLIYDISFTMDEVAAQLQFTGLTKGWKGKHEADDWWAVTLPRAKVTGMITLQDQTHEVQGSGYHDHNWNVKIFALKNIGWYWGKLYSERTAITWANILRTTMKVQPLLVINSIHNGYINVPPRNLRLTATEISEENKKMIPHVFTLEAEAETISLHVTMKSVDIHHVKIFPLMDYWRYHLKCKGSITINSETESIDDLYIAEFLKFR